MFASKPAQILRHSLQQRLRYRQRLRLEMAAARRAARQKLATIGASALAAVGETVQCIEGMQTRGSIDAFSREGGSGSSADDEEMEWLMQTQQMLAQERALHATPRAGDRSQGKPGGRFSCTACSRRIGGIGRGWSRQWQHWVTGDPQQLRRMRLSVGGSSSKGQQRAGDSTQDSQRGCVMS